MLLKKYEQYLQNLNIQISNGSFDVEINKNTLQQIVEIYKQLRSKNYTIAKKMIGDLPLQNEKKKQRNIISTSSPKEPLGEEPILSPAPSMLRDWNIDDLYEEDNIEAFNSIEMISAIFLKNLQEKIGPQ